MIGIPRFFGIVCRKSDATSAVIADRRAILKSMPEDYGTDVLIFDEDEHLASWSCAMNPLDLQAEVDVLMLAGLRRGIDFTISDQLCGSDAPWLMVVGHSFELRK